MALGLYSSKQLLDSIYIQEADPATTAGVVGPGSLWLRLSTSKLSVRDTDDAAWIPIGSTTGVLIVTHEEAQNVGGGNLTAGAWNTVTINTVRTNTISGASLAANRITLPAGTYEIDALCQALDTNRNQGRLFNITDNAVVLIGSSAIGVVTPGHGESAIRGQFTIAGTKVFEIQQNCQTTSATNGQGIAANLTTEVYLQVTIRQA